MKTIIVTVISPDRPGLVQMLSDAIVNHDGSWGQSSMANLAGQFAGILTVSVAEQNLSALSKELNSLAAQGMSVTISESADAISDDLQVVWLEITGHDQPGIVNEVSAACSDLGANLLSLETDVISGSMSGEPMFVASAELQLPQGLDADRVRDALEDLSDDLMVDMALADE
ncbi:MAG: glycine cleavage system protein R [Gammaproteobacteria bacterium]|jgi:glycine cleavage system regulatory protein|nr:glycine cleavage system protein R [Gammaproteobacteria bacterium]MCP4880510.1 glycine cleavage system protein R [Gammaproteobacteria bacterium]MDP6166723.1 ACT domain-containing protein [Gammaproteobacteria bacterium]